MTWELALSDDGLTYRYLFYPVGGRRVDSPHMIEQNGHLPFSFSRAKQDRRSAEAVAGGA